MYIELSFFNQSESSKVTRRYTIVFKTLTLCVHYVYCDNFQNPTHVIYFVCMQVLLSCVFSQGWWCGGTGVLEAEVPVKVHYKQSSWWTVTGGGAMLLCDNQDDHQAWQKI